MYVYSVQSFVSGWEMNQPLAENNTVIINKATEKTVLTVWVPTYRLALA